MLIGPEIRGDCQRYRGRSRELNLFDVYRNNKSLEHSIFKKFGLDVVPYQ